MKNAPLDQAFDRIWASSLTPEQNLINQLVNDSFISPSLRESISQRALERVIALREGGATPFLQSFLAEYGLSTQEGVALMCMAEAFLRIPDAATLDDLIAEKITGSNWQSHSGQASSFLVNASTWALMLTGTLLTEKQNEGLVRTMGELLRRLGEPVVRVAMSEAMQRLGQHFVLGETIDNALSRSEGDHRYDDYSFSFDMLGESALTHEDAESYYLDYQAALTALAEKAGPDIRSNSGISVKLSALHPRFEYRQKSRSGELLLERMSKLTSLAADANLNLNIDGEEARHLPFTLKLFESLARQKETRSWPGLGLVVQAYCRNSLQIIDWLKLLGNELQRKLMVRLVKGAYWDSEIKHAQVSGFDSYPVFTRKQHTDVSYLCAARKLLQSTNVIFPQFATHNAHSVAAVLVMAGEMGIGTQDFEFQRLYGMGEALHEDVRREQGTHHRIYAPVGEHEDLLAYLVRRLLENGANSSFVHQLTDEKVPAEAIAADPFSRCEPGTKNLSRIVEPPSLYPGRVNSSGFDLDNPVQLDRLESLRESWREHRWQAFPLLDHEMEYGESRNVMNPASPGDLVGTVFDSTDLVVETAFVTAKRSLPEWSALQAGERAAMLEQAADLYGEHFAEFSALLAREAGKALDDVIGEWREAIDFLRYYAQQARENKALQNHTPAGVFVCIAPWNFPLSIFTGQIAAALVTGNVVLAKPAEQSTLVAFRATQLLHAAGIPRAVLQLLPGDGESVGSRLIQDPRLDGVCFTGSLPVAKLIHRSMTAHAAPQARLIAETGGINAMIVDSTALPEQTIGDVLTSAFYSAGQRCSALRILYLQEEVADKFIAMLIGAMDTLHCDDPWNRSTDVGPVIDTESCERINRYIRSKSCLHQVSVPQTGLFVPPTLIEVAGIEAIEQEVFGPVLHVARYQSENLDKVLSAINVAGYGLTAAIHSRLTQRVDRCIDALNIGNIYVNRNQVGAVVESQPFGGRGLSGTGPKAGGPNYLAAFTRPAETDAESRPGKKSGVELSLSKLQTVANELHGSDWQYMDDRISVLKRVCPDSLSLSSCDIETELEMHGPTGERNIYELRPLGLCVCLGPGSINALEQALQALAFGNPVIICGSKDQVLEEQVRQLRMLQAPISLLEGFPEMDALKLLDELALVSWCGDDKTAREILCNLAAREGPLVRFSSTLIDPMMYLTECHVCSDITSSGGNLELMGAAD
ncbi:MAG: bifunctional proline dehydrogenase/L-glutamate gamma-semialdehyde dehydrogenase PutA [Gammaproteobacteria bacterium]